jgi:rhamnose transport system permease protein
MNALRRLVRPEQIRELVLILLIALLVIFFGTQIDGYYSGRTFNRISTSIAIITVVAVAQTLVVLARNIDLSVASIVGFTAYFVGMQLTRRGDIAPLVTVLMAVGLGALMGSINGLLIAYGRIPAIIVTLGTMALFRTVLVEYSGAKTILTSSMPQWLQDLPRVNVLTVGELEVRLIVVVALAVVLLFQLFLQYLSLGRRLYAIGSNPDAAKIAGFPEQRIVFLSFVICGGLCGLAGFMFLARFGTITVVAAQGMEMQSVAAAVVGGVSTLGGIGTALGAFLGAIIIGLLEQSLIRWPLISPFWIQFLQGILILVAVATDNVIMNRLRSLWTRSGLRVESNEEGSHGA